MKQLHRVILLSSACSLGLAALPAQAQEEDTTEIIVTATLRAESVQNVPIAINVLTSDDLRSAGATDIASALENISGVEFRTSQAGTGAIAVRGISELNTFNIFGATGTAVGLYIDQAPFSVGGYFPDAVLFDVARMEVLRGPQGTIFGEGSMAGTIRVITNQPNASKVAASIEGDLGSVKSGGTNASVNGMINLPLVDDKLALRAVGFWQQDGGWIDRTSATITAQFLASPNPILGPGAPDVRSIFTKSGTTPNANSSDSWGGRAQLAFTPDNDFTATASVMFSRADRGAQNRGGRDGTGYFSTAREGMNDDFELYGLVLEKRFDKGTVLSSTNYFNRRIDQTLDQFGILALANQIAAPLSGGAFVFQGSRADQNLRVKEFNQEIRFVSDFGGPFELTAGGFYRNRDVNFRIRAPQEPLMPAFIANILCGGLCGFTQPGSGDLDSISDSNSRQIALFAEGTFDITERLQFLAGGRFFNDKRKSTTVATSLFSGIPFPATYNSADEENVFNPRVSLRFKPSDAAMLYASISRGFRSGGQNDLYVLVPGATPADKNYASERMTAYEVGVKSTLADGRATLNGAVFYNDWNDLQVVTKEGTGGVGEVIGNAGSARSIGFELEGQFDIGGGFTLAANTAILDTELKDVIASGTPVDKVRIPGTANFAASGSIAWRGELTKKMTGFVRASVSHRSNALSGLLRVGTPVENTPGFTTFDLRAGIEQGPVRLELYAENLFNAFVPLSTFYAPNGSNPGGGDPLTGNTLYFQGSPRVIGVRAGMRF
ncbi:MAG: TonB-dependent receptor [Sphingomonadales bacterium]|nr:TonB-dependent receptor [Sphingomonadales bacterium]